MQTSHACAPRSTPGRPAIFCGRPGGCIVRGTAHHHQYNCVYAETRGSWTSQSQGPWPQSGRAISSGGVARTTHNPDLPQKRASPGDKEAIAAILQAPIPHVDSVPAFRAV